MNIRLITSSDRVMVMAVNEDIDECGIMVKKNTARNTLAKNG